MSIGKRIYWVAALAGILVIAAAAVTMTSRVSWAGGSKDSGDEDTPVAAGTIDDGADLLPQASITLDQAISAAQGAASGDLGEVDLEHYNGKLVFNVDVGNHDVKVDASNGTVLAADQDD